MSSTDKNMKMLNNKGSDKKKNPLFSIILVLIMAFIVFNNSNSSVNKKLIINEPKKITLKNEFTKLVEAGKVETVYMNENVSNILFTVKEGTDVKQVDYKINEEKTLEKLEKQSEKYKNSNYKKKKVIFVYKSFNPGKEDFKDYLLSKNIQVFKLDDPNKQTLLDRVFNIFLTLMMYVILFKFILFPSKPEAPVNNSNVPDMKFSDIAGNQEAKEEMQFLVDFLKDPTPAKKVGATMPKGVLLYGPPGTGKTLLAKAIAGEAGVPFYEKSGTDFIDKYVGVGSQKVRTLFKTAAKNAPCIIFIDEIDSIGTVRGSDLKEYDNTLNQLLVEMDGFASNQGVIVIAATNRLDSLDPGLIRPGRFDRHIPINLPDIKDRELLLDLYMKDKPVTEDVQLKELAGITYGYSGAAIKSFVNDAALIAAQAKKDMIDRGDFDEAYVRTALGAHPKKNGHKDEKAKLVAYHEAGHAIVSKIFTNDKVHKVTIVGTTSGVGGFTAFTPEKENLLSKEDLCNSIRVNYGGRIAEYLLYDKDASKVTTGASNDLNAVSSTLDFIIREVGMYDSMLFKLSESEYTKEEVIAFKKELATNLYNETLEYLEKNIEILHAVAEALIEKETLNESELDEIISQYELIRA